MHKKYISLIVIAALVLSGCTRLGADRSGTPLFGSASSGQTTAAAISATDISAFIHEDAASQLTAKERAEAASAQFYALQFGRVGAPRTWQGDSGASGRVSVGPYVRVNSLDCRQFSHTVTVDGQSYESSGSACRETDGSWDVVDS